MFKRTANNPATFEVLETAVKLGLAHLKRFADINCSLRPFLSKENVDLTIHSREPEAHERIYHSLLTQLVQPSAKPWLSNDYVRSELKLIVKEFYMLAQRKLVTS